MAPLHLATSAALSGAIVQTLHRLTAKIGKQIRSIIYYIHGIPEGSLVESSLLLSLFLAGGGAEDSHQIQFVRQRMRDFVEVKYFRNVEAVLEVLEEVWFLRAAGAEGKDDRGVGLEGCFEKIRLDAVYYLKRIYHKELRLWEERQQQFRK